MAGRARDHPEGARPGTLARGAGARLRACPADARANRGAEGMTGPLGPALTLGQMLDRAAARDPSQEAVVFKDERVSYGTLKTRADAFAQGLLALGIRPGD